MQNKSSYRTPVILAISLHVVLFILLFWRLSSSELQQLPVQPEVAIIKAVAVSPPSPKAAHPLPSKPATPKVQEPPKEPPRAEQKFPEKKIEQAQSALLRQQHAEPKKPIKAPELKSIEPAKKVPAVATKPQPPQPTPIPTPIYQEPTPPKPKPSKPEKALTTEDELAKAINEEKAEHRKAAAKQLKLAQEKELEAQIAAEKTEIEAAKTKDQQSEIDKYKALIEHAISQHWVVPGGANPDLSCTLLIQVGPGGKVLNVQISRSSGDIGLDNSARSAVFKASPLPTPDAPELAAQFREMRLTVKPEQITGQN